MSENEGRITGTVTDDALAPIAGAQVGILNSDPQVIVTTNDAGRFALVGLVPGTYTLAFQKLGFSSVTRQADAVAGQSVDVNVIMTPIAIDTGESRYFTVIGEGYFACGADLGYGNTQIVTWGNLHACLYDNHKPNVTFEPTKAGFTGVLDEVVWAQSSGFTSQSLYVSIVYGHRCTPFCSSAAAWDSGDGVGDSSASSPVRFYVPFDEKDMEDIKEDPMPLKSVTFPNRNGGPPVIVFQQRMTHYITMFWGPLPYAEEEILAQFTAMPDA